MGKYKKCPRCELNWIAGDEELCEVCKAELGKASSISLLEEDEDDSETEERICPICKVNYLEPDEDICAACRAEQAASAAEKTDEDAWQEFVDDEPMSDDDEGEVSLSQLQDEEFDEQFEEEEEEESVDDEPDDFDTYGDVNDYEEDDEDDDSDKDDDDF